MGLEKRLLSSHATRVLLGLVVRIYRALVWDGFLFRHDPALIALLRGRAPAIFACWHQDFVHTLGYLSRYNARRPTFVLASASRDGALAVAAAAGVGFREGARGSSARGGAGALLGLHRLARRGAASIAVVCDGPRPPAREMKPGALHLARETGLPLWLVRTSYRPQWVLERSWARFVMPKPGARAVCLADGPIRVPAGLDRPGLDRLRQEVEGRLSRLAERADREVAALPRGVGAGEGPDPEGRAPRPGRGVPPPG